MKKLIASLMLVFGVFSMAQAQEATESNPNAAKIQFEKTTIDYGTITKGADGMREFTFVNEGKEPLILNNVRASCGCTTPKWTREPVAPGEDGIIKVKYDTKRVGNFNKTITVQSNASNGTVTLMIKGKILDAPKEQTSPEKKEDSKISNSSN